MRCPAMVQTRSREEPQGYQRIILRWGGVCMGAWGGGALRTPKWFYGTMGFVIAGGNLLNSTQQNLWRLECHIGEDEAPYKCLLLLIEGPDLESSPGSMWWCSKGECRWLHGAFTLSLSREGPFYGRQIP